MVAHNPVPSSRPISGGRVVAILLDVVVFLLLVAIVFGDETAQLFKVVFFLLTVAALVWDVRHFAVRAVTWTILTTAAVIVAVVDDRAPVLELLDVAYIVVVLALVYGVTSRRAQQAELINEMLDRRDSEVAALTDLAELKADFTAMVAHEFGNPLAALRRMNEMMSLDGLDEATRRELVTASQGELDVLRTLVADVNASVEIERDGFRVNPAPVRLGEFLAASAAFGRSVSSEHSFVGAIDDGIDDLVVMADAARLGQVIRNLLSNAVKYSAPGSTVRLQVSRVGDAAVRFEVVDNGLGISDADLERVFGKYDRAAAPADVSGVGLGLYICHNLLRSHGSELIAESVPGSGSTFRFDLPLELQFGPV